MNCYRFRFFIFSLLIFISCNNTADKNEETKGDSIVLSSVDVNSSNRLDQIWGNYQFVDKEVLNDSNQIDLDLYNYVNLFPQFSQAEIGASLENLITKTESSRSFFDFVKRKFPYYLNHPNSPLRNDIYFEQVLKIYQFSDSLQDSDKVRDKLLLDLIQKNQVGTPAADFVFTDTKGASKQLYSYKASYKLLVFYDPNCTHCNEVLNQIKQNKALNKLVEQAVIKVIIVDPIGNFEDWKAYQTDVPDNWVNGYDKYKTILTKSLYNIVAYPTIYLLDKENKVLLKDVYFSDIESFLLNN